MSTYCERAGRGRNPPFVGCGLNAFAYKVDDDQESQVDDIHCAWQVREAYRDLLEKMLHSGGTGREVSRIFVH